MRFVNMEAACTEQELLQMLPRNDKVNEGVRFAEGEGKPLMHFKKKGKNIRMRCEILDRPTKDNGFLMGTYFAGRTKQVGDKTRLYGVIVTEPYFHLIWLALVAYFVWMCIAKAGFSVVPICLIVFVYFMFRGEYKKQPRIKAYLARACKRASAKKTLE